MISRTEKEKRKSLQLQQKHPNTCFCKNRLYLKEEFIEKKTILNKHPVYDPPEGTWAEYSFYKCSKCGKEYNDAPAMA